MADKIPKTTPIRAYPHPSDSRANIPAAELESFARPEEKWPVTMRYPRDPTLDPQLVWKGKDEQDGHDLEVPAIPIYIQETIDVTDSWDAGPVFRPKFVEQVFQHA